MERMKSYFRCPRNIATSRGFILLEWLWMMGIGTVLLGSLFVTLEKAYALQASLDQYAEITVNNRFLRQLFWQELRFAQGDVEVYPYRFRINDGRPFVVSYETNQFYKILRDGQRQPLSGTMVEGAGGAYLIVGKRNNLGEFSSVFKEDESGLITLTWGGTRVGGKFMYETEVEVMPHRRYFSRWSRP